MASVFSRSDVGVGDKPSSVTMADVDHDGDLDMLVANQDSNTVSLRLNDGSGGFSGGTEISAGIGPSFVAAADVDRDGDLDLLVANRNSATVSVRLNNGSGFFSGGTDIRVALAPVSVAMADVDRDGDLDMLAVCLDDSVVAVSLNDGRGRFSNATTLGAGVDPYSVTVADVDRDGDLDMLFANYNDAKVTVQLNNHYGNFFRGPDVAVGRGPLSVAMADVDRDGDLDLLAGNQDANTVSVRLNDGRGGFSGTTEVAVGNGPRSVTLADMDGDGDLDLLTANFFGGTISLRLNDGTGGFSGGRDFAVGANPASLSTADVDRDGDLDLLVANWGSDTVSVLINDQDAAVATRIAASGSGPLKIGDRVTFTLTTDSPVPVNGTPKLTLSNGASAGFAGLDASGRPTFAYTVAEGDTASRGLTVTGLDTTGGTLGGAAQVSFSPATTVLAGSNPSSVTMADMDRDGDVDMLVANRDDGTISLRLNDGHGRFTDGGELGVGLRPSAVATADVNEDGSLDILAANQDSGTVTLRRNDGSGGYSAVDQIDVDDAPVALTLADVNGDGRADLITANQASDTVSVKPNVGGTFGNYRGYATSPLPSSVAAADVDRDGDLDLITANRESNTVSVRLNDGHGNFAGGRDIAVDVLPVAVTTADVNGDGRLDLIVAKAASGITGDSNVGSVSVLLNTSAAGGPFDAGSIATAPGAATGRALDATRPSAPTPVLASDTGASTTDRVTSNAALTLSGVERGAKLSYAVDGGPASTRYDPAALADGRHTLTVTQTDAAGNLSKAGSLTFTLDRKALAPVLALTQDTGSSNSDRVTSDARITLSGVEAGARLAYVVDGRAVAAYDPAGLANGTHTVSVTQTDLAGNVSSAGSLTFTLADGAPAITSGNGGTSASLTVAENETFVAVLKASDTDGGPLSWSIAGGADAGLFAINARTGALTFKAAPDFEVPEDIGKDNVYDVTVRVTDGRGSDTQALSVAVFDVKGQAVTGSAKRTHSQARRRPTRSTAGAAPTP